MDYIISYCILYCQLQQTQAFDIQYMYTTHLHHLQYPMYAYY